MMFTKITVALIILQIAFKQVLTGTLWNSAIESQLANLRGGQHLLADELQGGQILLSERMDSLETNMLERIKDLLCTGCKPNITQTTTQKPMTVTRSCKDWLQETRRSDIYMIKPSCSSNLTFNAYCLIKKDDFETSYWTVILRRKDGSVEFNRNWAEYQRGFGNLDGEFILGLPYIHLLTQSGRTELLINIQLKNYKWGEAKYDHFRIGNTHESYVLKSVGSFTGNITNNLKEHVGSKWSTKDVRNDKASYNCADQHGGGWWYSKCGKCSLTGRYNSSKDKTKSGSTWWLFASNSFDIKYALMALREIE